MRRATVTVLCAIAMLLWPTAASAGGWASSVSFTNQVVSSPTTGGGYPDVNGAPVAGNCGRGAYDANHSESWLAVKPGTENIVGSSKFFFDKYSTFYNFHNGAYTISGGKASNVVIPGYDCVTTGTQAMPPSWTNTTDPNVDFDTQGRVYQTMLPFNAYWTNLHPNGEITVSYSDDLGRSWTIGNHGQPLEFSPNESSLSFGHVEDKQWVAVNHVVGNRYQDHVYAMWALFNGFTVEVKVAVSRDRGQTFSPAVTLTPPQTVGASNTYVIPSIDATGNVYVAFASFPNPAFITPVSLYVTRSTNDGVTFGPFVKAATAGAITSCCLPNTTFRDGITESFAASPTDPGHLYLTYEDWDGTQMDVKFTQSTDGGLTWSAPVRVNDNVDPRGAPTDQFQPSVAAGPSGTVAIAFYDRRLPCPTDDKAILPVDRGRANFCINTSLQAYKDTGGGAVPVGGNVRISRFTWDPQQPGQQVGGLGQMACASHDDPCSVSFIGDYFGLAISGSNIYALDVSTHYPSDVTADEGGPVYYQQQVLATVPRSEFGAGY